MQELQMQDWIFLAIFILSPILGFIFVWKVFDHFISLDSAVRMDHFTYVIKKLFWSFVWGSLVGGTILFFLFVFIGNLSGIITLEP